MEYTLLQKADLILAEVQSMTDIDPVKMFLAAADKPYINMHGPEHHVLDGACLLMAYHNAGGTFAGGRSLSEAMEKMKYETLRMPGAACGLWGACGAITAAGAVLAIIDGTGPLTDDGTWGEHMKFTSEAIAYMGKVNGPRCCKRDAMIAFSHAVAYMNAHYAVHLEQSKMHCHFSERNKQCIGERCPFHEFG